MRTQLGNVLLLFEEEEQPSAQSLGLCLLKSGQVTGEANGWGW